MFFAEALCFSLLLAGVYLAIAYIARLITDGGQGGHYRRHPSSDADMFPNGRRRSEYHRVGFTDQDIKYFHLDQPGAPPPEAAGFAIEEAINEDIGPDW